MLPQGPGYYPYTLPREIREEAERFRRESLISIEVIPKSPRVNTFVRVTITEDNGDVFNMEIDPQELTDDLGRFLINTRQRNNKGDLLGISDLKLVRPSGSFLSYNHELRVYVGDWKTGNIIFRFNAISSGILLRKLDALFRDVKSGKFKL